MKLRSKLKSVHGDDSAHVVFVECPKYSPNSLHHHAGALLPQNLSTSRHSQTIITPTHNNSDTLKFASTISRPARIIGWSGNRLPEHTRREQLGYLGQSRHLEIFSRPVLRSSRPADAVSGCSIREARVRRSLTTIFVPEPLPTSIPELHLLLRAHPTRRCYELPCPPWEVEEQYDSSRRREQDSEYNPPPASQPLAQSPRGHSRSDQPPPEKRPLPSPSPPTRGPPQRPSSSDSAPPSASSTAHAAVPMGSPRRT
jgi:hypothetical protein